MDVQKELEKWMNDYREAQTEDQIKYHVKQFKAFPCFIESGRWQSVFCGL